MFGDQNSFLTDEQCQHFLAADYPAPHNLEQAFSPTEPMYTCSWLKVMP
jgi:hypothetical protein